MLNKLFISSIILASSLFSNTSILSSTQNEILDLDTQKASSDVSKLSKDWIDNNAITYTYAYSKQENTPASKLSILSINQSIFRSGGIYYAIKYASNINENSKLSLEIQKRNIITNILTTTYNIKKLDLQILKQKLSLKNAIIDYEKKKESVFNGLLDISFLNNAVLTKNNIKMALIDLEFSKQNLINTLSTLSDLKYNKIPLPTLKLLSKDSFSKDNLNIKKANIAIKTQKSLSGISNSQYLPKVSVNYTKTINHTNDKFSNDTYGFNVIVPIDFKTSNAITSNKLAYLKTKVQKRLIKIQEDVFFKSNKLEIKNISKKIDLTKQNIKAYKELLIATKEQYNAGLKTSNDVEVLSNSKKSEAVSIKIYQIDKQIKLLELYNRIANDKI
jgi:outer membrane protein TolC